jgi:hypothetical protein
MPIGEWDREKGNTKVGTKIKWKRKQKKSGKKHRQEMGGEAL